MGWGGTVAGMGLYLGNTKHTSKEAADTSPPRRFGMAMNRLRVVCIITKQLQLKN